MDLSTNMLTGQGFTACSGKRTDALTARRGQGTLLVSQNIEELMARHRQVYTFSIDSELMAAFRARAAIEDIPVSRYIEELMARQLHHVNPMAELPGQTARLAARKRANQRRWSS